MNREYDTIELADGTEWFILSEITYEDNIYQLVIETNDNDDFFPERAKVFRKYIRDGKKYFHEEKDKELLNKLIPLLVPESKEFIDNPEKLEELLENQ